ncbi:MAG: 3'-5' exonuclease [Deltaproteobacteria bacterium]|jgi:ribonuclease D|nr:3'-5' exonuclease [Deltaproteobacteria bacterium]MDP7630701.1 ribonuclease D [SAR324 cluster bacterium]
MADYEILPDLPDEYLQAYLTKPLIAVDCEMHGLRLYRDDLCLIQVGDDEQRVALVRPQPECPPNLKTLLTHPDVIKVFHFALSDVGFLKVRYGIDVNPLRCTRVMSRLIRTYSQSHGLKDLCKELLGIELNKEQQQTNWMRDDLSTEQLQYAANDVLHLVAVYRKLEEMIRNRPALSTSTTVAELNETTQAMIPGMVELLIHGYGDEDSGWKTTLFSH